MFPPFFRLGVQGPNSIEWNNTSVQKKRRANKLKNGRQKDLKNNSSKHVQQKQNSQRDKKNVGGDEAMCRGQGGQGGDLGEFGGGGRDLGAEFLGLRRHGPTLGLILI